MKEPTMSTTSQDLLASILATELGRLPDLPSPLLVTVEGPSGGYFAVAWTGDTASVHRLDTQVLIEAVKQAHAAGYPVQHEMNTSLGGYVSPIHGWIVERAIQEAEDAQSSTPAP